MKLWTLLKLTFNTMIKASIYSCPRWDWKGTGLQTLTPGRSTIVRLSHSLAQSFARMLEGRSWRVCAVFEPDTEEAAVAALR